MRSTLTVGLVLRAVVELIAALAEMARRGGHDAYVDRAAHVLPKVFQVVPALHLPPRVTWQVNLRHMECAEDVVHLIVRLLVAPRGIAV